MKITIEHPFHVRCHDLRGLLTGCNKISTFCSRLEKQSALHPNRYDPDKYKGDGLELLTEVLIKLSPVDNRIGVRDYAPVLQDDTGVDGVGVGANGQPATVQVKYRSNATSVLTANKDHLSNFIAASQNRYKVGLEDAQNMLVITTAEGLHHFTESEMLYGKVRCLGYRQLRELLDNNDCFWELFRRAVDISESSADN